MELKVNEYQLPEVIQFNFDELKRELTEKVQKYETIVYTDEQIKEAKADKANLNKLKKALNDERIRREKEYMIPFNEFKSKVNEIISIIDRPVQLIDQRVKDYEEEKKNEKRLEIGQMWETKERPDWLTLPMIFDERWLNASVSMKHIEEEVDGKLQKIFAEVETLEGLSDFSFESIEEYKRTLDINKAIAEGKRLSDIQKRKAEAMAEIHKADEALTNTPLHEQKAEEGQWINFSAKMTIQQAKELKKFFNDRQIEFKAI